MTKPPANAVLTMKLAHGFLEAAEREVGHGAMFQVWCFLVGHALELGYKAVLIADGSVTEKRLRGLGHDLERCAEAARQTLPAGLLDDDRDTATVVAIIADPYRAKALEYGMTGVAKVPEPEPTLAAVRTTLEKLQGFVEATVREHLRSEKIESRLNPGSR